MHLRAPATILSVRMHGEHGAVVRALTEAHGLQAGYVRGARSRRLRPVLQPGNEVVAEWRARTDEQLAGMTVEPVYSRAALFAEPLPAAAIEWATALTAATLPEAQSYPHIHAGLSGVLLAIEGAPSARGWAAALARFEFLLLGALGYGVRHPALPAFLREGGEADWPAIGRAMAITGRRIERDLLSERRVDILAARGRLVDRLRRAVA